MKRRSSSNRRVAHVKLRGGKAFDCFWLTKRWFSASISQGFPSGRNYYALGTRTYLRSEAELFDTFALSVHPSYWPHCRGIITTLGFMSVLDTCSTDITRIRYKYIQYINWYLHTQFSVRKLQVSISMSIKVCPRLSMDVLFPLRKFYDFDHATCYQVLASPRRVDYASLARGCGRAVFYHVKFVLYGMYQSGFVPVTWNVAETLELSALGCRWWL